MHVESTDPEARRLITLMGRAVEAHGGYVHPHLVVHQAGSDLWITLPRSENPNANRRLDKPALGSAPLLVIPDELLIPVAGLSWEDRRGELTCLGEVSHLSNVQRYLLELMVDLFNVCRKIEATQLRDPRVVLPEDPELLELVREARPGWLSTSTWSIPELLVRSHLIPHRTPGSQDSQDYLVPMIDMLNHHPYGSRYEVGDRALTVRIHHPGPGDQVFVRYNRLDSLDLALNHGYVERATRFVASVAGALDVGEVGVIRVEGAIVGHQRIPAPLVRRRSDGFSLDGVVLGEDWSPRLVPLIGLPLRALGSLTADEGDRLARRVVAHLVDMNVDYYDRLSVLCERGEGTTVTRALLSAVAKHQLSLLRRLG